MSTTPQYLPSLVADVDPWEALSADYERWELPSYEGCVEAWPYRSQKLVKRIAPHTSLEQVYRRLPSAPDFEYFGYLTRSRIVYGVGDAEAAPPIRQVCCFHSHPTDARYRADMPSASDVYHFLFSSRQRSITRGRHLIWWWDRDNGLIATVRRLIEWKRENLTTALQRASKTNKENWPSLVIEESLAAMGCDWSHLPEDPGEWAKLLRKTLRLKTNFLEVIPHGRQLNRRSNGDE